MEIIERKRAKLLGMTQYFTGKPCRNQHITYRYVMSGSCADCIRAHTENERFIAGDAGTRSTRLQALSQLVEMKVRCYACDLAVLRDTAASACKGRFPELTDHDVTSKSIATDPAGGTALYRVKVHPDDIELLRGVSNALLATHAVDITAARNRVIQSVVTQAQDVAPADWTERP